MIDAETIYRPAAVNQLVTIGKQLDVEVFQMGIFAKPQAIVKKGLEYAKENGIDMTADEAKTYFEQLNANSLDDDLLDGVSGGMLILNEGENDIVNDEYNRGGKRKSQC